MSVRCISLLPELRIYVTPILFTPRESPRTVGKSQPILMGTIITQALKGSMGSFVQIYHRLFSSTNSTSLGQLTTCRQLQPP